MNQRRQPRWQPCRATGPGSARTIGLRQGQPAQCKGHQPVQDHRLKEVIGADVAGLGRQEQTDRDQPDRGTRLGPDRPRQPIDTPARRAKGQNENEKQPRRQPERPRHQVEDPERAAMRVERVERPHERVGGENRRILLMQEQRQPIGLVAIEAVIAAQAQVKTQDDDIDQPSWDDRGRLAARMERPQTSMGSFPTSLASRPEASTIPDVDRECAAHGDFGQREFRGRRTPHGPQRPIAASRFRDRSRACRLFGGRATSLRNCL